MRERRERKILVANYLENENVCDESVAWAAGLTAVVLVWHIVRGDVVGWCIPLLGLARAY